jgi:hypothetical protein
MKTRTAIRRMRRWGEVRGARMESFGGPALTEYSVEAYGRFVSFIDRAGDACSFVCGDSDDAPPSLPRRFRPGLPSDTLNQALRYMLNRCRRMPVGGDGFVVSAGIHHADRSLRPTAWFVVGNSGYVQRDDKQSLGIAESWVDGSLPLEMLLDYLQSELRFQVPEHGDSLYSFIDECRRILAGREDDVSARDQADLCQHCGHWKHQEVCMNSYCLCGGSD